MTTLVLASRSAHKVREVHHTLAPLHLHIVGIDDLGLVPDPEEDGIEVHHTFRDNAIAKAVWFARRAGRAVLADDSGLRVHALGGEPGVRTKRFAGRHDLSGGDLDRANNRALLDRMEPVPDGQRGARYVCCAAVAWPDGRALTTMGTVAGEIARDERGVGGFGYDPLFHVPALDARFAEVAPELKNAMSHRARAFRALAAALARAPWPVP